MDDAQPEIKQNVLELLEQAVRARAAYHGVKNPEDVNDAIIAAKQELIEKGIRLENGVPDEEGTARTIAGRVTMRMFRERAKAIKTTSLDKPSSFSGRTGHDLVRAQEAEEGKIKETEEIGEEDIEPEQPKTPAQLEEERLEREERQAAKVRGGVAHGDPLEEHTPTQAIADKDIVSALNARIAVEKLIEKMDESGKYKNAIPKFEKLLGELEAMPDDQDVDLGKIMKDRFGVKYSEVEEPRVRQTETPEFKRWFGDSKVVDKDGKPLVVYHGTFNDFNQFNVARGRTLGAHFGTAKAAESLGGKIYPVFLSLKNPFNWDRVGRREMGFFSDNLDNIALDIAEQTYVSNNKNASYHDDAFNRSPELLAREEFKEEFDAAHNKRLDLLKENSRELYDSPEAKDAEAKERHAAFVKFMDKLGYDGISYINRSEDSGHRSYIALRPEQIKSAIGNKGTFDPSNPDIRYSEVEEPRQKAFLRPFEAAFDKVERHSPEVAEALRRTEVAYRGYIGKANLASKDLEKFKREDVNSVMAAHREAYRRGDKDVNMSGQRREISNILKRYYGEIADIRRELGMEIEGREAGKNVLYVPDMLNDKTLDLFMNRGTSPEAKYAKTLWAKHVASESGGEITYAQALEDINDYIGALGSDKNNYLAIKFGAIRKAAGYGLPAGLREKDAFTVLSKYGRRAAADLSMFKELESNKRVAGALGLYDPVTGNKTRLEDGVEDISPAVDVKNAMKWITGGFTGSMQAATPKVNSVVRLVNNALLGTATGIRDIVSVPVNTIPYINSFSDLGAAFKGLSELRKNQRAALESGAQQPNMDKVMLQQIMDSPDRFSAVVNKVATGLRKWQGREALENLSRDITFSMGKEVVRNYIVGAKAGNKQSLRMVEKFKTGTEGDVLKISGKELEKAIDTMAANFSDRIQGTYGGRGLPAGIADSQFAPFWALQKWGLEKSNTIYQDVITPFITGENRLPLITYTLGSVLTGAAIQELNELMSGKKGSDPTIKEVLAKGRAQDYVAQLATLMQLGSLAGVVGDAAKFATDVGIYGKTPRNAVSFPTATAALDTQEKITDMMEAIRSGENPFEVWKMFTLDMLTKNVQGARLIANRTINKEKTEDSNDLRALRIFQQLEGAPAKTYAAPNAYLGIEGKEFKKETDLREAAKMVPGMVQKIMQEKDPIKIKDKLEALKRNSFQSMPSPDRNPKEFGEFYQYLVRLNGRAEADQFMRDYFTRRSVNMAKSKMIP